MRKTASFARSCKFLSNIFVNIDPKDIIYIIHFVHLIVIHKFNSMHFMAIVNSF